MHSTTSFCDMKKQKQHNSQSTEPSIPINTQQNILITVSKYVISI